MTEEAVKTVPEDYSANREKLRIVRDGTPEEADRALTELLELNRGLLRKVVARFRDRGADPEDLMQIGTVGMIKAVRSFDLERGDQFFYLCGPFDLRRDPTVSAGRGSYQD